MNVRQISRKPRASLETIERDYDAALDRLEAGNPTLPRLKRLAKTGKLEINFSTAAAEARRSRTLIALENCRLPRIRARVLKHSNAERVEIPGTLSEVILRLRSEKAELIRERDALLSENTRLLLAEKSALKEANKWRAAFGEGVHPQRDSNVVGIDSRKNKP